MRKMEQRHSTMETPTDGIESIGHSHFNGFRYIYIVVGALAIFYGLCQINLNIKQDVRKTECEPDSESSVLSNTTSVGNNLQGHGEYDGNVDRPAVVGANISRETTDTTGATSSIKQIEPTGLEFGFPLPCSLTDSKEALSALRRMTTIECRRKAAALACLAGKGELYSTRLPRYCPTKGGEKGDYLGCYLDSFKQRILNREQFFFSDNTPERCIDQCLQIGCTFSGVQYGKECFCGLIKPNSTLLLPEADCNISCSGDPGQICGGRLAMNVYHTGVAILYPPQVGHSSHKLSEPGIKVLYLFYLSGRSVRQVRRLFKALYHSDQTYFYIHVDLKEDYMFRELLPLEKQFSNVRLVHSRQSVLWGGSSHLDTLLKCMGEALAMDDWHWDYIINLSESDFPIKSHEKLIKFLSENNGTNFVDHLAAEVSRYIHVQGLRQTFLECENRVWNLGDRKLPLGIQYTGGSDWPVLTRSFVHFLVHNQSELVAGVKAILNYTIFSAELLVLNSEFCMTCDNNNLRLINWRRPHWSLGGCNTRGIIDWCGASPYIFRPDHWPELSASTAFDVFIARKFHPLLSQAIINHVDAWLYGPQPNDLPGYNSYWENEFHLDDRSQHQNSAFYTVYQSLSRLTIKLMKSEIECNCNLTVDNILEANLFNNDDVFKGLLVMFEATKMEADDSKKVILETIARPKQFYESFDSIKPLGRLLSMEVGTKYASNEKVFLNFGRIFGPNSNLGFHHKWSDGNQINVTFVWMDPTNTVASLMEAVIPAGIYTGHNDLSVSALLRPGVWTVKLMCDWKLVAETKFLVVPLSHNGTTPIDSQEAEVLNSGSTSKIRYSEEDLSYMEKILGFDKDPSTRSRQLEARQNGTLVGTKLLEWIDQLVEKFYDIQDVCYVTESNTSCIFTTCSPCHLVSWSSRFPDPKSALGNVSKFTGLFVR